MKINNTLYIINNFNYFYALTEKEQKILQTYDVFYFYEILIGEKQIKNFEKLLSKYLTLIKLNGYNIKYEYAMEASPCIVRFNYRNIKDLYKNHILSLNDLIDIENILLNNFSNPIKYERYFYFKSYEDTKNFLKDIDKTSRIFKYL